MSYDTFTLEPGDTAPNGSRYSDEQTMDELSTVLGDHNLVYINHIAYQLESYGEMQPDGSRTATLRIWNPF